MCWALVNPSPCIQWIISFLTKTKKIIQWPIWNLECRYFFLSVWCQLVLFLLKLWVVGYRYPTKTTIWTNKHASSCPKVQQLYFSFNTDGDEKILPCCMFWPHTSNMDKCNKTRHIKILSRPHIQPMTGSSPRRPLFLHAISFEWTIELQVNYFNQFYFIFIFK